MSLLAEMSNEDDDDDKDDGDASNDVGSTEEPPDEDEDSELEPMSDETDAPRPRRAAAARAGDAMASMLVNGNEAENYRKNVSRKANGILAALFASAGATRR